MGTTEKEMKDWKEKLWEISSYDSQHDTVFYYGDIVDFVEKLLEQERQRTLEEVGFTEDELIAIRLSISNDLDGANSLTCGKEYIDNRERIIKMIDKKLEMLSKLTK